MKTLLFLIAGLTPALADEIPRTLFVTNKVAVLQNGAAQIKRTRYEVTDRIPSGALVRTFKVVRKMNFQPVDTGPRRPLIRVEKAEPPWKDEREDGEVVFISGSTENVGFTTSEETHLFSMSRSETVKGTTYSAYSLVDLNSKTVFVDKITSVPNPAWAQQEQRKTTSRVVAYQTQQAEKGFSSFQIELGKRYLRGDGVETNLGLARHWLQAACTNGESQATNLLKTIPVE